MIKKILRHKWRRAAHRTSISWIYQCKRCLAFIIIKDGNQKRLPNNQDLRKAGINTDCNVELVRQIHIL